MNHTNRPRPARLALICASGLGAGLAAGCPGPATAPGSQPSTAPGPACLETLRRLESEADTTRAKGGCPTDDCGGNSAYMNGYHVDELHVLPFLGPNEPNHEGVEVVGFIAPDGSASYSLFADNGELVARQPTTAVTALRGSALVMSKILVRPPGAAPGQVDVIVIHDYDGTQDVWFSAEPPVKVHRYLLTYAPKEHGFTKDDDARCFTMPICKAADDLNDALAWAVVVSGERYEHDPITHLPLPEIAGTELPGWFNIACQGNALFKTKMLGYDPAPASEAMPLLPHAGTTAAKTAEREATLKMFTADYCGDNRSFTENGTPLRWINRDASADNKQQAAEGGCALPGDPQELEQQLEAIWGRQGALCLRGDGSLRLDGNTRDSVNATCGATVPSCDGFTPQGDWMWKTYVCP